MCFAVFIVVDYVVPMLALTHVCEFTWYLRCIGMLPLVRI